MVKNLGTIDKASRIFLAVLFTILIITGVVKGVGLIVMAIFCIYLLLSAILGHCAFYAILGIHTLRLKSGVDD